MQPTHVLSKALDMDFTLPNPTHALLLWAHVSKRELFFKEIKDDISTCIKFLITTITIEFHLNTRAVTSSQTSSSG